MLIVVFKPCGCNQWERGHKNPNCAIYKQHKQFEKPIQKLLNDFKKALKGE